MADAYDTEGSSSEDTADSGEAMPEIFIPTPLSIRTHGTRVPLSATRPAHPTSEKDPEHIRLEMALQRAQIEIQELRELVAKQGEIIAEWLNDVSTTEDA